MTDEEKNKEEAAETTEMPATESEQTPEPAEEATEPDVDPGDGNGSGLAGKLKIAAISGAAVVVAFLLFIAPGDRVLGFESDDHGMERSYDDHDGRDDYDHDMDDRGDYEDHGPGGMYDKGGYGGPGAPPHGTPPPPMSPGDAPQAAPENAPQGGENNR